MSSHLIGWTELFSILMWSPEMLPKAWRTTWVAAMSSFVGFKKMAASSAYREALHLAMVEGSGDIAPFWVASSSIRCKGSMARIKSIGDRGLPWRTPLAWWKLGPCRPLMSTLEVAV